MRIANPHLFLGQGCLLFLGGIPFSKKKGLISQPIGGEVNSLGIASHLGCRALEGLNIAKVGDYVSLGKLQKVHDYQYLSFIHSNRVRTKLVNLS